MVFSGILTSLGWSHEFWITKKDASYILHSGHAAHSHGEQEETHYDRAFVQGVQCIDEGGKLTKPAINTGFPLTIQGPCGAVMVDFSSGYWTKTPYGLKNLPKNEAKAPVESWYSKELIKRLDVWSDALARPLTTSLELVPLEDPLKLKEGRKLHLQLMRNGKPAAACPVAYDGDTRGMTDETGKVNIRIRHGGLQIIQASFSEPTDGVKSDKTVTTATLVFQLPD